MSRQRRVGVTRALVAGEWVDGDVAVDGDGRVVEVGLATAGRSGRSAVPGFVDLHVNGYAGLDVRSADVADHVTMAEALAVTGVVAYQPTMFSATVPEYCHALQVLAEYRARHGVDGRRGTRVLPAHLEGPFLNEVWAGAHDRHRFRLPSIDVVDQLLAAGPIGMMTLAPELPDAFDIIDALRVRGVQIAVGHTDASTSIMRAASAHGARILTHCFNGHRRFRPRDPGPAGVALTGAGWKVSLICDGVHLGDETLLMAFATCGARAVMVTDAIAAAGTDCTEWTSDADADHRPRIIVVDGAARYDDGTIAGGIGSMDAGIRHLVEIGVDLRSAVHAASTSPAAIAGLGRWDLTPGSGTVPTVIDDRLEVCG